jgi:hypothetical protein
MLPSWYRGYMLRLNLSWKVAAFRPFEAKRLQRRWEQPANDSGEASESLLANCFVTSVPHPTVGIGHTLSEYNSGVVLAEKTGATYVHCPLPEPWDSMLHFSEGRLTIADARAQKFRIIRLPRFNGRLDDALVQSIRQQMLAHAAHGKTLFILGDGQSVYDHSPSAACQREKYFSGIKQKWGAELPPVGAWHQTLEVGPLRTPRFFSPSAHNAEPLDPQKQTAFALRDRRAPGKINVAVHIRRRNTADGWVTSMGSDERADGFKRFLDLDYFLGLCQKIERTLGADSVQFNIFGQGEQKDYEPFKQFKHLQLCLDSDAYESFYNLTLADILITSPSAFSYMAGMLCQGLKLANYPWWHDIPERDDWIRVQCVEELCLDDLSVKIATKQNSVRMTVGEECLTK